ncbi:MAG: DUF3006 domain-containing protein [Syntrophomonas sp.]|nr:DUF3006 domain-containing protein [Syntrophomonas sp.]
MMMRKGIIDRFEGDYAIVEIEGSMNSIMRSDIPNDAHEGDLMVFDNNQWTIARENTDKRKKEIQELADEVWK